MADCLRAGFGLFMTVGPLAVVGLESIAGYGLAIAAIPFALFAARIVLRYATRLELTPEALICRGPRPLRLPWRDLMRMKLAFFSTRRWGSRSETGEGWMELTLVGETGSLMVESTLDDFGGVVRRAAEAASEKGLRLDAATRANLRAMGAGMPVDEDHV